MWNYIFNFENFKRILSYSLKNSFNIKGRTSRREFLAYVIYTVVISLFPFVGIIIPLMFVPANFSMAVRRFHDVGISGKRLLLICLFNEILTGLLFLIAATLSSEVLMVCYVPCGIFFIASICYCWKAFCSAGNVGPNLYGDPPDDDVGSMNTDVCFQRDSFPVNQRTEQSDQRPSLPSFNRQSQNPFSPKTPHVAPVQKSEPQTGESHCPKCNQIVNESWTVCPFCSQNLSTIKHYAVLFVDDNGTVLKKENVRYGELPVAPPLPIKPATSQYSYEFTGWSPEIQRVVGDIKYIAVYTEKAIAIERSTVTPVNPAENAPEIHQCPKCHMNVEPSWIMCPCCGQKLSTRQNTTESFDELKSVSKDSQTFNYCPNCGAEVEPDWTACPECGEDLKD